MILAAGFGTRLRPYSLHRPKPLFPILDTPLLIHTIKALQRLGIAEIIVNCHYLCGQIQDALAVYPAIKISIETIELGTGGGLRQALPLFGAEPLLVVNGDIFHDIDLSALCQRHLASGADATLVLHDYSRFNKILLDPEGLICGFEPTTPVPRMWAFTGIQVLNPTLLEVIPPQVFFNLIDCYQQAIDAGKTIASFIVHDHFWTDMGTVVDYLNLHEQLLTAKRFAAVTPFYVGENVSCPEVEFSDWVSIGSGATIGPGAHLSRVVVWDGATVAAGATLQDTIVI